MATKVKNVPNPQLTCNVIPTRMKQDIERRAKTAIERMLDERDFKSMRPGDRPKEFGHNTSGKAEDTIRKAIEEDRSYAVKDSGKIRDSADFLVNIDGTYYDFNTKLLVFDKTQNGTWKFGRPNLVALNRLFYRFIGGEINSYIVLYAAVWVDLDGTYEVTTHLVDILQYLQYVTADSGTGQTMTKTEQLYYCNEPPTTDRIIQEDQLMTLRQKTSEQNIELRRYQKMIDAIEMALVVLRRKYGSIEKVETQKLRRLKLYKENNHEDWETLKDFEEEYNLSSLFQSEQDKELFLEYVA